MRVLSSVYVVAATAAAAVVGLPQPEQHQQQQAVLQPAATATAHQTISDALYGELERYARLVDISYCIGAGGGGGGGEDGVPGTGLTAPFSCASRCREFPEMQLVTTWHDSGGGSGGGGVSGRLGRLLLGEGGCGYVAVDTRAREVVVAFRGTYSLADTVVDLSTVPQAYEPYAPADGTGDDDEGDDGGEANGNQNEKACPNCTVHSGFLAAWRRTRGVVLPAVAAAAGLPYNNESTAASAPNPPLPVHLVGHSLGGAVAALAALDMRAGLGWPAVRVTTYGEPRIGNAALATYLEGVFGDDGDDGGDGDGEPGIPLPHYHRVTHQGDPVPLLPPAEWGYRAHAGELYIATAALPPAAADVRVCRGRADAACLGGDGDDAEAAAAANADDARLPFFPYPWERVFAHRDYFWRLGLCVPGGDPANWGRRVDPDL